MVSTKTAARKTSDKKAPDPPALPDQPFHELYNQFISSLQLTNIELSGVNAVSARSDLKNITLRVESKFSITCPVKTDIDFTVEATLSLKFYAKDDAELGDFNCVYRLAYTSEVALTDEIFEQFSRRNVPLNVWPFIRELVMNITQRFGWSGFVLPPYKVPSMTPAPAQTEGKPKPQKKAATKKATSKNG